MAVEDYTLIRVSMLNKEKLDNFKIIKDESYNSALGDLIKFGEKYDFKGRRIRNLTKKMEDKDDRKIKIKQKENS